MPTLPPRLRALAAAAGPRLAPVVLAASALGLLGAALSSLGGHFLRSPLARDPAQFQFIAWAISRGSVDYRDLRDMNAPLSHAIHWLFLHLGGLDDGRFRRLELLALVATVGLAGAVLPRRAPALRPVAALCAVAAVVAEYLRTFPWHLSQRDGMALWFVLPATALAVAALDDGASPARRRGALLAAGALVGLATTLKPYFGLMGVPLMVGALAALPRGRRAPAAAHLLAGGLAGALPALAFTLALGSLGDYVREGFVHGPLFYQGIYDRPLRDILLDPADPFHWLRAGAASSVIGAALVGLGALPRRDLPAVLAPGAATLVVLLQHKGFVYHLHLAAGATLLLWAHLLLTAAERATRALPSLGVGAVGASLALWSAALLPGSALLYPVCLEYERLADGHPEALAPGPGLGIPDYFPRELRLAGAWLRAHTAPDARVYVYGHDVAVLLYGRRRPATATLSSASIDLAGLLLPPARDGLPAARVRGLEAMQRRNIADDLGRLRRDGAAACVLIDRSPWMTEPTALADQRRHAPARAAWVEANHVEAAAFGPVHVWAPRAR